MLVSTTAQHVMPRHVQILAAPINSNAYLRRVDVGSMEVRNVQVILFETSLADTSFLRSTSILSIRLHILNWHAAKSVCCQAGLATGKVNQSRSTPFEGRPAVG